jgi:hypothetical protein
VNTTLTSLAVSLVLLLLAALVGPLCVDWNAHRDALASHISAAVGEDVDLRGDMSVRLLPMPSIEAENVVVGDDEVEGVPTLKVPRFTLRLALLPLMRGVVSIQHVELERPRLQLWTTDDGNVLWPFGGPQPGNVALGHAQLERLIVTDGQIDVFTPDREPRRVDGLTLDVEAVSLLGPFNGRGQGRIGRHSYSFTFTTGKREGDSWPLSVNIGSDDRLSLEGIMTLENASPSFEGKLAGNGANGSLPWKVTGNAHIDTERMDITDLGAAYGAGAQALKWQGSASLDFDGGGADVDLHAAYLDADRFVGADAQKPLPLAAAGTRFTSALGFPVEPSFPVRITMRTDRVVLGGAFIENIAFSANSSGGEWVLADAHAVLPGQAGLTLDGTLARGRFQGKIGIATEQPQGFLRWLDGTIIWPTRQALKHMSLTSVVDLDSSAVRFQHMSMRVNEDVIDGQATWLVSTAAGVPHMTLNMSSDRLDLDALFPLVPALTPDMCVLSCLSGLPPEAVSAATEDSVKPALLVAFSARQLSQGQHLFSDVRLDASLSKGILALNRFDVGDAFGLKLSASGRVPLDGSSERLSLKADIKAGTLGAVLPLLPANASAVLGPFKILSPVDLKMTSEGQRDKKLSLTAKGTISGLDIEAKAVHTPTVLSAVEAHIKDADGRSIGRAVGLPFVSLAALPNSLTLILPQGFDDQAPVSMRYEAGRGNATFDGQWQQSTVYGLSLSGQFDLTLPDNRDLRLRGVFAAGRGGWQLRDMIGSFDGNALSGELKSGSEPARVTGRLEFGQLSAYELIDLARDYTNAALTSAQAKIDVSANKLLLWPYLAASKVSARVDVSAGSVSLQQFHARMANGEITGSGTVASGGQFTGALSGTNLRLEQVLGDGTAVTAGLSFAASHLETLLTPKQDALAQLAGLADFQLKDLVVKGIGHKAVNDVVAEAAAQEPIPDADALRASVASRMENSTLNASQAQGVVMLTNGTFSLPRLSFQSSEGPVAASGTLNLATGALQANLTLGAAQPGDASTTFTYAGAWQSPERAISVDDVSQVIMLRVLDRHYKRLEAEEAERHDRGRIQREMDKMQNDVKRAAERARRAEESLRRAQKSPPAALFVPLPLVPEQRF